VRLCPAVGVYQYWGFATGISGGVTYNHGGCVGGDVRVKGREASLGGSMKRKGCRCGDAG
jgi:hypothetical protein